MVFTTACEYCTHNCLCLHSSLNLSSDGAKLELNRGRDANASFYKIMTGDFSSKLKIPADFARRMNYRVCKDAILMGPSGYLWHVNFHCTGVSASFRDGWKGFVSDNRIKAQDILVFRYVRDTYFVVQVFGAIQGEHQQNHKIGDPKEKILSGSGSQKNCEIIEISSEDSSTSTSGAFSNVGSSAKKVQRHEEALAVPNPVKSMEPMFSMTLTKSATSRYFSLTIPQGFGDRWLPNKRVEVSFLHHKNPGEWRYMLRIDRCGREYVVCWKGFVIDNELHKGDNCVFKLINEVKYIFMIYVNR